MSIFGDFSAVAATYTNICNVWSYFRLTDLAGQRLDFQRAAATGKPILWGPNMNPGDTTLTPDCLASLDVARPFWNQIAYVFLDEPGMMSQGQLENYIAAYHLEEAKRWLARKLVIVNFKNPQVQANDPILRAKGIDIVGFEAYMDATLQDAPDLVARTLAQVNQFKAVIGARPMLITIQAYDRNGDWKNLDSLRAIQTVPYVAAYNDPNVVGLMMFSLGRPGGTMDHLAILQPEHQQMWQAISGEVVPVTPPVVTPTAGTWSIQVTVRPSDNTDVPFAAAVGNVQIGGQTIVGKNNGGRLSFAVPNSVPRYAPGIMMIGGPWHATALVEVNTSNPNQPDIILRNASDWAITIPIQDAVTKGPLPAAFGTMHPIPPPGFGWPDSVGVNTGGTLRFTFGPDVTPSFTGYAAEFPGTSFTLTVGAPGYTTRVVSIPGNIADDGYDLAPVLLQPGA